MEWMILPLMRYADFEGRSRRLEYWMYTLLNMIIAALFVTALVTLAVASRDQEPTPAFFALLGLAVIVYLALLVPGIAVTVRRLHDRNMSGWAYLMVFIPYIGSIALFVIMLLPGTQGPNDYGPDPKDPHGAEELDNVFR